MIGKGIKLWCRDYTNIENYEQALNDDTQMWEVHHRLETHFSDGIERPVNARLSMEELIALDVYFDRPPEELIFLTKVEHCSLHFRGNYHNKGKKLSEERKRKLSEKLKGRVISEEARKKLSISSKRANGPRMKLVSQKYKTYKANGGKLTWNEYQRYFS